jgi:hypothetical protein
LADRPAIQSESTLSIRTGSRSLWCSPHDNAGFGRGDEDAPLRAAASEARVWTNPRGK